MNIELSYRPSVGIVLFNSRGQVFVAERLNMPGTWQMPQGGIEKGEALEDAALRELEEEIGTSETEILAFSREWLSYDIPKHLLGKAWKGKYRGQKQRWYAMRFTGKDEIINIKTKHPEFSNWKWVEFESIIDLVVPFKRDTYVAVFNQFSHLASIYGNEPKNSIISSDL